MPERPDYAALTRGQLAALDRINAGATGDNIYTSQYLPPRTFGGNFRLKF